MREKKLSLRAVSAGATLFCTLLALPAAAHHSFAAEFRMDTMAEIEGRVTLGEKKRGKRIIWVQPIDEAGKALGEQVEHQVPHGKHLRVHAGDFVRAGEPLVLEFGEEVFYATRRCHFLLDQTYSTTRSSAAAAMSPMRSR